MELVYVEVILAEGKTSAWSSSRGSLETGDRPWEEVFEAAAMRAVEPQARAMILLAGDDESVGDGARGRLMDSARRAGYGMVRIETGAPMNPEEAFELLLLPFT